MYCRHFLLQTNFLGPQSTVLVTLSATAQKKVLAVLWPPSESMNSWRCEARNFRRSYLLELPFGEQKKIYIYKVSHNMCIYIRGFPPFSHSKKSAHAHHGLTSCIIFQASSGQIQNWTGKHQILRSGAFFCAAVTAAQRFWAGGGRKQWWLVGLLRVAGWLAACPFFQHSAINHCR